MIANKNYLLIDLLEGSKSIWGRYLLALALFNINEYDKAEYILSNQADKVPKDITPELKGSPQALYLFGQIRERLKRNDDAISFYL